MFSKADKKTLLTYSGFALLFIYPIIQSGVFYRDDLDRSITGQYGWRGLGRPVADILMKILSASGHYNLDLFPYTMIASCLFIAGASLLLSRHLIKLDIPNEKIVAALLIFNPFILQNMAYRYDCLGMSVAFFLATMAYTYDNSSVFKSISVKIITGVLSLTLYQPCANIFIGFLAIDFIIIAIRRHVSIKEAIALTFRKAILFISFYFIYALFFAPKNNSRAELIPLNTKGLAHLSGTLNSLKELVLSYFYNPVYIYFTIPIVIICVFMMVSYYTHKEKILPFIIYGFISFLIFLVSLLGPAVLLQDAPVFPRSLVSFSVILVIIAIPVMHFAPCLKYVSLIPVITVFAFSAQLSSAMKSQQDYENFVFNMIAKDISSHNDLTSIGTVGWLNFNERTKILIENKPLIGYFVFPATEFLASFQLINKGLPQTLHGYGDEKGNKDRLANMINKGVTPVSYNEYYSLFISDNNAIVVLGRNYF
ncbi:glucosyltransferase domain-containing protein [Erwinia amylovora]|uniref:glucosyltransferase domain-containing protein n=1 Tax=Erwinia amylovora TaxID=552 RepID=UPI00144480E9|nr:glucosyltransferase domain-containing protein [Erwinia amylovora]